MTQAFDVAAARDHFPALKQSQVFFDNAGGSQVLGEVIESISKYLSETNAQLGGTYNVAKQSEKKYNEGMQAAAKYINATPEEIVLGSSTTQLMRNLSYALRFETGDELILSKLDHEANISAWVQIADVRGLTIKWWTSEDKQNPKLDAEVLRGLLTEKTRLVACTHTSNILGTISDIKKLADTVHTIPGAMLCIDGVAFAPHRQVDVKALSVDLYAFSWYKVYGPHLSMLYADRSIHPQIGSLGHYFNPSDTLEGKLGLAGSNYELTQSIPKVLDYFGPDPARSWAEISAHEEKLQSIILSYLNSNDKITVFGETSASSKLRVPVISFTVAGRSSKDIVNAVQGQSNIGFKYGHFYSKRLIDNVLGLGEDGVVRISMVHYNTEDEAKEFVNVLDKVLSNR